MDHPPCTFCQAPASLRFRVKDLNRRLSDEIFRYYHCDRCGLIFMHPLPTDLGKYYPASYYGKTQSAQDLEPEFPFNRYKVEIVRQFVQSGRLLEVGPSRGTFAYLARESGFDVSVIERDAQCCRFLQETLGIKAQQSDTPTATLRQQEPCDVIALWQVIEHLDDPWIFLRTAADRLKPGGVLVLATPNPEALQFKLFGRFWFHLDAPRHLQLIPAKLLTKLGASLGLREVLLTSEDADAHRHNEAGWHQSVDNLLRVHRLRGFVHRQVERASRWMHAYEHGDFRSCTYTLVLQKPG